jgi:hypothetical protein
MEALTTWLRGPQTLRGSVLRVLMPRTLLFVTVALAILAGNALSTSASSARLDARPAPAPMWSLSERAAAPDCEPLKSWPHGKPAAEVVVSSAADGKVSRMSFDRAWAANHNATDGDDLWVLAVCP